MIEVSLSTSVRPNPFGYTVHKLLVLPTAIVVLEWFLPLTADSTVLPTRSPILKTLPSLLAPASLPLPLRRRLRVPRQRLLMAITQLLLRQLPFPSLRSSLLDLPQPGPRHTLPTPTHLPRLPFPLKVPCTKSWSVGQEFSSSTLPLFRLFPATLLSSSCMCLQNMHRNVVSDHFPTATRRITPLPSRLSTTPAAS